MFRHSRAANSVVNGPIWPKFKFIRDFMHVLVTRKYKKDWIKNNREKVETSFSPLQVNGDFLLPWKPEFWSKLPQNLMQPFPHPSDAIHKIWLRLANWLQRYLSLEVLMTMDGWRRRRRRRTDDGPLVYYKLTLWAFGSGELKIQPVVSEEMR